MNVPFPIRHFETAPALCEGRTVDVANLTHAATIVGDLTEAAAAAGALAQSYFRPGQKTVASVHKKADGSPVTQADLAVNQFLEERLHKISPEAGWLSEESTDALQRLDHETVFVVDPIDGTRSFAAGDAVWAVSIALVRHHRPIIGIVYAPALGETYVAVKGNGARLNGQAVSVSCRQSFNAEATVGGPFGFAQRLRKSGLDFDLVPRIPSLAVRIVKVAAGTLDAALISANAQDWDIAASDLIVSEAGGRLINLRGREPLYNRTHTLHGELVAASEPLLAEVISTAGLAVTS